MLRIYEPSEAEKIYYKLKDKLEKKYHPNDYVVINPRTKAYFVAETSVEAMKKARKRYPKGELFLAQIGRIAGFMK
ncbi:hypothetical protein HY407_01585 [Candidatus Gottesmanbacteria bacterium]|nr:hypothetical protein [Candidatus Gottesmanbacteria bacterium]